MLIVPLHTHREALRAALPLAALLYACEEFGVKLVGLSRVGFLERALHLRRGGRGWDVAWGSVSGGDDIPCGRPRPCRWKDEGDRKGPHAALHHPRPYGDEAAFLYVCKKPTRERVSGRGVSAGPLIHRALQRQSRSLPTIGGRVYSVRNQRTSHRRPC